MKELTEEEMLWQMIVYLFIRLRAIKRKEGDFESADIIRDGLVKMGLTIEDGKLD